MKKPLLTDDILEGASQTANWDGQVTKEIYFDPRDLEDMNTSDMEPGLTTQIEVVRSLSKSRRLENQKRSLFQSKLNRILAVLVLLLIALVLAIIYL